MCVDSSEVTPVWISDKKSGRVQFVHPCTSVRLTTCPSYQCQTYNLSPVPVSGLRSVPVLRPVLVLMLTQELLLGLLLPASASIVTDVMDVTDVSPTPASASCCQHKVKREKHIGWTSWAMSHASLSERRAHKQYIVLHWKPPKVSSNEFFCWWAGP